MGGHHGRNAIRALGTEVGPGSKSRGELHRKPIIFKVVAKLSGAQFHESSALDGRRRILAFFDGHLKESVA